MSAEPNVASEPVADRPVMPGYGIAATPEGLLPWEWAAHRLAASRRYWLATRTEAGAPHLAAVWAVWYRDAVCFSTGARSRKARNLVADPRCSITPEDAGESVVVEGLARRLAPAEANLVAAPYQEKYGLGFPPGEPVFAVRPVKVLGIIDGEPDFTSRATRWRF